MSHHVHHITTHSGNAGERPEHTRSPRDRNLATEVYYITAALFSGFLTFRGGLVQSLYAGCIAGWKKFSCIRLGLGERGLVRNHFTSRKDAVPPAVRSCSGGGRPPQTEADMPCTDALTHGQLVAPTGIHDPRWLASAGDEGNVCDMVASLTYE